MAIRRSKFMARVYDYVVMDSKGRVLIPSRIRQLLNLREGMVFLVEADVERSEVRLIPLASGPNIYRVIVKMADQIGALASILNAVAKNGIDILMSRSRTIRRGETAEWEAVLDFSSANVGPGEFAEELRSIPTVLKVEVERLAP